MIRLSFSKKTSSRVKKRLKNKAVIRKKISGTQERPRLVVFRSHKHIYAQLVDDQEMKTLLATSSLKINSEGKKETKNMKKMKGCEIALEVGKILAEMAKKKGINRLVFDRSGYLYHGRVKAIAEGARSGGMQF